jgi:signal transduction histidine kinase
MDAPLEQEKDSEHERNDEPVEAAHAHANAGFPPLEKAPGQAPTLQETQQMIIELFTTLNHEFRSPLAVIKGSTSTLLLQEQLVSLEERREFLQMIQAAEKRLEGLTGRLLEIAQLEAGAFQMQVDLVDIPSIVRSAMDRVRQLVPEAARERFTFQLQCRDAAGQQASDVPPVKGDLPSLQKVLEHLLENAVRFSPNGGSIEVCVQPVSRERLAALPDPSFKPRPFLEICVCDEGIGIPEEHLEAIFSRFYRVETGLTRETSGLGLGLTICKHLVALHQGRIWAERRPTGGSVFHLWLPAERASSPRTAPSSPQPTP